MDMLAEKFPLWLDCDPGHDDAFAILFAAYHPSIDLLGISTVHGNASVEKTTYNAISLLTAIGRTCIPVYSGASAGLVRPAVHAEDIHGESGLDGTSLLPKPAVGPKPGSAVDAMAAALWATKKGTAWLVATGTMTNIAQLFILHPDLAEHIRGLSIMGGAIGNQFTDAVMGKVEDRERIGNWSAWAEFNILVDPEAAAALFANPILASKMVMIPLDVSHLVLATKEVQEVLLHGEDSGNPRVAKPDTLRTSLVELLMFFAKTYAEVFGITEGPPLHDPLAVAVVLDGIRGVQIPFYDWRPDVGVRERFKVKVVTEGTHEDAQNGAQTGRTIVTLLPEGEEGVKIPRGLDVARFWNVLEECLSLAARATATETHPPEIGK